MSDITTNAGARKTNVLLFMYMYLVCLSRLVRALRLKPLVRMVVEVRRYIYEKLFAGGGMQAAVSNSIAPMGADQSRGEEYMWNDREPGSFEGRGFTNP